MYVTKRGGTDLTLYDATAFTEKYGVRVDQFVDYKALVGDNSDNIPGVAGVGPKAAQKLLGNYDTLEACMNMLMTSKGALQTKMVAGRDNAFMSQQLARIFTDAPIAIDLDEASTNNTHLDKVAAVLKKFEFTSLVKRLPDHMRPVEDTALYFASPMGEVQEVAWHDDVRIEAPVVLQVVDDELYLSLDGRSVMHAPIAEVSTALWRALEFAK